MGAECAHKQPVLAGARGVTQACGRQLASVEQPHHLLGCSSGCLHYSSQHPVLCPPHLMMTTLPLNCSVSLASASIMSSSQSKHSA